MDLVANIFETLNLVPVDRRVGQVLRHSNRFPIVDEYSIVTAALTPEGIQNAEAYGRFLSQKYRFGRLMSSPIGRCIDTAAAIARGAGVDKEVIIAQVLSHPYHETAWNLKDELAQDCLPDETVSLVQLLLDAEPRAGTMDLFVTHDTVVGVLAQYLLGEAIGNENLPEFLEGIFFWHEGEGVRAAWRGKIYEIRLDRDGCGDSGG